MSAGGEVVVDEDDWGEEVEDSLNLIAAALRRRLPPLEVAEEEGLRGEESSMAGGGRSIREREVPSFRMRSLHSGSSHFQIAVRLILDLASGEGR